MFSDIIVIWNNNLVLSENIINFLTYYFIKNNNEYELLIKIKPSSKKKNYIIEIK